MLTPAPAISLPHRGTWLHHPARAPQHSPPAAARPADAMQSCATTRAFTAATARATGPRRSRAAQIVCAQQADRPAPLVRTPAGGGGGAAAALRAWPPPTAGMMAVSSSSHTSCHPHTPPTAGAGAGRAAQCPAGRSGGSGGGWRRRARGLSCAACRLGRHWRWRRDQRQGKPELRALQGIVCNSQPRSASSRGSLFYSCLPVAWCTVVDWR